MTPPVKLLLSAAIAVAFPKTASSSSVTLALYPEADAMVYQSFPTRNYGARVSIGTRLHGSAGRRSYMRFDLKELLFFSGTVAQSCLRMKTFEIDSFGQQTNSGHEIKFVSSDSWIEGDKDNATAAAGEISWNLMPLPGDSLGAFTAAAPLSVASAELPASVVDGEATNDGKLSLCVLGQANQYTTFFSRDISTWVGGLSESDKPWLSVKKDLLSSEVEELIADYIDQYPGQGANSGPMQLADIPLVPALASQTIASGSPSVDRSTEIQSAVDAVSSAGGGTVFLESGTYGIDKEIVLKCRVALKGSGTSPSDTVIKNLIGRAFPAAAMLISSTTAPTSDVAIANLTFDGGLTGMPFEDEEPTGEDSPDLEHVKPGGVKILDSGTANTNILIYGVNITNTTQALTLKHCHDAIVSHCKFRSNGGVKFQHTAYFMRVQRVLLSDSELCESPSGNGLKLTKSHNVIIQNCLLNGNRGRGMVASNDSNLVIHNSHFSNNGQYGILCTKQYDDYEVKYTKWYVINDCVVNSNGLEHPDEQDGIRLNSPTRAVCKDTSAASNVRHDISVTNEGSFILDGGTYGTISPPNLQ